MFGNNIEKMAFDSTAWARVEVVADGSVIYMGKASNPDAASDDPVWFIKRIIVSEDSTGGKIYETKVATQPWKNKWSERAILEYKYF